MHLELPLQVSGLDVHDGGKARRHTGGIEQAVDPAEGQHRLADSMLDVLETGDVRLHPDAAIGPTQVRGKCGCGVSIPVCHHHAGALSHKLGSRRAPDAAGPTDHQRHVTRHQQRLALALHGLLHLAALQRPVLELEHRCVGQKLETAYRFGVADRRDHSPVARVGGAGTFLVLERRDHPQAGDQHHFGPIAQRGLPVGVPLVVFQVGLPAACDAVARSIDDCLVGRVQI